MKKVENDNYERLIMNETLSESTECYNTKSCAACCRWKGCEYIDRNEKRKSFYCLNENGKVICPSERILQYIHALTEGCGFDKDEVVEIIEDGKKYNVSGDTGKLEALAMGLILPDVFYEFSTKILLETE